MKYTPLYGKPCKLYEIDLSLTWTTPVNYMKYTHLYIDNPVNYMKYLPLYGHPCKLCEIHTLTGTTQ